MENNDHDMLIRIETKLDTVLSWIKVHDQKHFRIGMAVGAVLLAALVGLAIAV